MHMIQNNLKHEGGGCINIVLNLNKHGGMVKWLSSISDLDEYFVTKVVRNLL